MLESCEEKVGLRRKNGSLDTIDYLAVDKKAVLNCPIPSPVEHSLLL
jgi:hypothetical protein